MFQFVSKRFETIESVDLDIFSLFQCFMFQFQFVSKCFETIRILDLDIFSLFQYVSVSLLYNLYVSTFPNTRIWGLEFSPFYVSGCFETFRNN